MDRENRGDEADRVFGLVAGRWDLPLMPQLLRYSATSHVVLLDSFGEFEPGGLFGVEVFEDVGELLGEVEG